MMNTKTKAPLNHKTKIVATIGPASNSSEVIRQLIQAGMNVARLNFSHGTHEEHSRALQLIRQEAKNLGEYVAVLQDLSGPKLRIAPLSGGEVHVADGAMVLLKHYEGKPGDKADLFVESFDPVQELQPGEKILLADGSVELITREIGSDAVSCEVLDGGVIRSRSGIALPHTILHRPSLTDKDLDDLEWGIEHDVDYVALSFVGSARDVETLRRKIKELGSLIPIIAKIERATALESISEIVGAADAVMVARGDLGLEIPLETVPKAQKLIIEEANYQGTPVITATQMLLSMVNELRPTRAEVSDVFTAVLDGTDAVMLSEETTIGKHPAESVKVLANIVRSAESEFEFDEYKPRLRNADRETVSDAICYAACAAALKVSAAAIVACTRSGYTARLVAKYRPQQTLFAVSSEPKTLAQMALYWGVQPVFSPLEGLSTTEENVTTALAPVRDTFGLKPGARVVVTAGSAAQHTPSTTLIQIREIART